MTGNLLPFRKTGIALAMHFVVSAGVQLEHALRASKFDGPSMLIVGLQGYIRRISHGQMSMLRLWIISLY
jgi:hypothetical protein